MMEDQTMKKTLLALLVLAVILSGCALTTETPEQSPGNETVDYVLSGGRYIFNQEEVAACPYLLIQEVLQEERFTVVQHIAVSYQPGGVVQKNGNELVLQGIYGSKEFCYLFTLVADDTLRFDLGRSKIVAQEDCTWADGMIFTLAHDTEDGSGEANYGVTDQSQMNEDQIELMEKYPQYFGLNASAGLDVIVWQMAKGSYSFGLLEKDVSPLDRWITLKGVSADQMKVILSTYTVDDDHLFIVPWQNPISSYFPDCFVGRDEADIEAKTEQYINEISEMLFG